MVSDASDILEVPLWPLSLRIGAASQRADALPKPIVGQNGIVSPLVALVVRFAVVFAPYFGSAQRALKCVQAVEFCASKACKRSKSFD